MIVCRTRVFSLPDQSIGTTGQYAALKIALPVSAAWSQFDDRLDEPRRRTLRKQRAHLALAQRLQQSGSLGKLDDSTRLSARYAQSFRGPHRVVEPPSESTSLSLIACSPSRLVLRVPSLCST